jgi:hypothetical protein
MKQFPRFQINRGAVIIKYKQPYVDWARAVGPNPMPSYSLADANEHDGEMFLVPTYESLLDPVDGHEDAVKWVEKRWKVFFEHFLEEWMLDDELWPKKRTLKMFREWFEVDYRSVVWDMGHDPILLEDWAADEYDSDDMTVH